MSTIQELREELANAIEKQERLTRKSASLRKQIKDIENEITKKIQEGGGG